MAMQWQFKFRQKNEILKEKTKNSENFDFCIEGSLWIFMSTFDIFEKI